ncbi:hypothetical protein B0181_07975 [Moraxella caviae]|uniref:Uncharacterized protein n=1 Tax=Moraxella caviae TaxID=34060 RepID=A0A1S9ZYS1_9GAMM|nr:hypothetical protein [Moraxella caviae]OOR88645.1 hypothetical protein B0181_07975 [Moraxella caviae]STZ13671.1 Uncharacterised protein [Moraxella caviae]
MFEFLTLQNRKAHPSDFLEVAQKYEKRYEVLSYLLKLKVIAETGLYTKDIKLSVAKRENRLCVVAESLGSTTTKQASDVLNAYIDDSVQYYHTLKSMVYAYSKTIKPFAYDYTDQNTWRNPKHLLLMMILDVYLRNIDPHIQSAATFPIYELEKDSLSIKCFKGMVLEGAEITRKIFNGTLEYRRFDYESFPEPFLRGRLHNFSQERYEEECSKLITRIGQIVQNNMFELQVNRTKESDQAFAILTEPSQWALLLAHWVSYNHTYFTTAVLGKAKQASAVRERNRGLYFALQSLVPAVNWIFANIRGSITSLADTMLRAFDEYATSAIEQSKEYNLQPMLLPNELINLLERNDGFARHAAANISLNDEPLQFKLLLEAFVQMMNIYQDIETQAKQQSKNEPVINLIARKRVPLYYKALGAQSFQERLDTLGERLAQNKTQDKPSYCHNLAGVLNVQVM